MIVTIRWDSEEAYKGWKKSPVHIAGHREKKREKPQYVIDSMSETFTEVSSLTPV
ncbi:Heme-degrading monooxygenase HmoA [compost metagenome]